MTWLKVIAAIIGIIIAFTVVSAVIGYIVWGVIAALVVGAVVLAVKAATRKREVSGPKADRGVSEAGSGTARSRRQEARQEADVDDELARLRRQMREMGGQ